MVELDEFKEYRAKRNQLLKDLQKADDLCCLLRQQIKELDEKIQEVVLWR